MICRRYSVLSNKMSSILKIVMISFSENVWAGLLKLRMVSNIFKITTYLSSSKIILIRVNIFLFYHSCNECYPCRSSYCTTENLFGICNDNFHRYFHSCGYIHLYSIVYIHLRLRREYIIEIVTNLTKGMLNTKKKEKKKKKKQKKGSKIKNNNSNNNINNKKQKQQQQYETPLYFF